MPMIPTYQGGVPSVVDSGQAGRHIANLPNQTINYAKLMQEAQQPLQDFATNAGKALQTIAARNIKAESDEAEMKYMNAVQSRLYDPDAGYFNQKGKNAVDAYDGAMQGLKKDADDILGSLSPWAREAVQSRIQDRLRSAQGQSMQWMTRQRDAWHIGTSKARIDSLVESIGQNYGNKDYCGASYQSLDDEITALAKMQGLGEEQTKALREGYWDMSQAQRYSTWGQDDAVAALTDFQKNRGSIGNDVAAKIGTQLWQQAKQPLAMTLANTVGETMLTKKDFIKESLKPGHRTGIPAIDGLNQSQKIELFSAAYSYAAQKRAASQADLNEQKRNSLAEASDQGYSENELSRDDFVSAYGEKRADEEYSKYKQTFDTNAAIYRQQYMSDEQIAQDLENARPTPGSHTYAEDKKLYDAQVKAATEVVKLRREDPVGAAIATGQANYAPLQFDNPNQLKQQLQIRLDSADSFASIWGAPKRVLSKAEASQLVKTLDNMDIDGRVGLLTSLSNFLGSQGIRMVADQLKSGEKKYAIAMSGFDIPNETGVTAGEMYLRGLQKIEEKAVKIDAAQETGLQAQLVDIFGETRDGTKPLFTSEAAQAATVELARGVAAYQLWRGGDIEDAATMAVGGKVDAYNGKKVVLPRGVDASAIFSTDLSDLIDEKAKTIRRGKDRFFYVSGLVMTADEFADRLPKLSLQTESVHADGSVTYSVLYNDEPVYDKDQNLYTIDLTKGAE